MFYAHNDKSYWGEQFVMACGRARVPFKLFRNIHDVPAGAQAFVRLSQQDNQRQLSKDLVTALNKRGVITLPGKFDAKVYDDKIAQFSYLEPYMPETHVILNRDEALAMVDKLKFPIISKGSEGSGSRCVRFLENKKQARAEAVAAFGDGIPGVYGKKQRGHIYWQTFIPENPCDYRIIIAGPFLFGIIRHNRPDVPFASGSGNSEPIMSLEPNTRERRAAEAAVMMAKKLGSEWIAFDFVFDKSKVFGNEKIYCLEISASWTTHIYAQCPVWQYSPHGAHFALSDNLRGGHMFDMAVEIMKRRERLRKESA